jgi:hypothetical protein
VFVRHNNNGDDDDNGGAVMSELLGGGERVVGSVQKVVDSKLGLEFPF